MRKLKASVILISISLLFSVSFNMWAEAAPNKKASPKVKTVDLTVPMPLDILEKRLAVTYRSPSARILKRAYDELENKNYGKAQKILASFSLSGALDRVAPLFGDYVHWLRAAAYRGQSEEWILKKKFSPILKAMDAAIAAMLQIEKNYPYSPFIKEVQRRLADFEVFKAESYWGTRQWKSNQGEFENALARIQKENSWEGLKAEPIYHYAESCQKKSTPLCGAWLRRLVGVFSKKPEKLEKVFRLFPNLKLTNPPAPSRVQLSSVPYKAPDLDQSAMDSCMLSYSGKKYKDAISCFKRFLDEFPRSNHKIRAQYHLAYALAQKGDKQQSQQIYRDIRVLSPMSYYGLLAAFELKLVQTPPSPTVASSLQGAELDPGLPATDLYHLDRAKRFLAERAPALAAFELKEFKSKESLSEPFLNYRALLNFKTQNFAACFGDIWEEGARGSDIGSSYFLMRMLFPTEYKEIVEKYSDQIQVDPLLVYSLIKQESGFAIKVNSGVGAQGLMQLMPYTALEVEKNLLIEDLDKADHNIRVGIGYLKKMIERYHGNWVFALAAYNAGPKATDRWVKASPQGQTLQDFIESITYKETREYVSSIIRNYYWYFGLMSGEFPKSLDLFWSAKNAESSN